MHNTYSTHTCYPTPFPARTRKQISTSPSYFCQILSKNLPPNGLLLSSFRPTEFVPKFARAISTPVTVEVRLGSTTVFERPRVTSASLIGRLRSSAFRLSTTTAMVGHSRARASLRTRRQALPAWDSKVRWNNLSHDLAVSCWRVQAEVRTHLIHRPARDVIPPPGGARVSSYRI